MSEMQSDFIIAWKHRGLGLKHNDAVSNYET